MTRTAPHSLKLLECLTTLTIYSTFLILPAPAPRPLDPPPGPSVHKASLGAGTQMGRRGRRSALHWGLPGLDTTSAAPEPAHLQHCGLYRALKIRSLSPVRLDLQQNVLLLWCMFTSERFYFAAPAGSWRETLVSCCDASLRLVAGFSPGRRSAAFFLPSSKNVWQARG